MLNSALNYRRIDSTIKSNLTKTITAMKNRNKDMDREIDEILQIDVERRAINTAVDNMKAEQNRVSKLIPQYKKEGKGVIVRG